jgi:LAS superfamily LD-carboxypeptidase LdcB
MSNHDTAPSPPRRVGATAPTALVLALTALATVTGCQSASRSAVAEPPTSNGPPASSSSTNLRALHRAPDTGGGDVPSRGLVLDEQSPSVANLDPDLLEALRRAATSAAADGVRLHVNSGWRSAAHQQKLLQDAVAKYGSKEEAARWVATPQTSAHVSGEAVDIGPTRAARWLADHGTEFGLCRVYRNEPWHYELRPDAADHGCPAMYADPTEDPRMQQ